MIAAPPRRTVRVHFQTTPKMTQLARTAKRGCPEPFRIRFPTSDFGLELQNLNLGDGFSYLDFGLLFSGYSFQNLVIGILNSGGLACRPPGASTSCPKSSAGDCHWASRTITSTFGLCTKWPVGLNAPKTSRYGLSEPVYQQSF